MNRQKVSALSNILKQNADFFLLNLYLLERTSSYVRDNCSGKVLTDVLEAWERALRPRVACPRPLQMAVML